MRRWATAALLATAACSSGGGSLGDAEVTFLQGMIPHHEQAIEMAEIALDPTVGAGPAVVDLATRIDAAQDPEVELMTGWLEAAGVESMSMDAGAMADMAGMMSVERMDALAASTGPEFDRLWMEMMIEHHEGAILQAEELKAAGNDPEVIALADAIITAQRAEIDEMRALLGG